MSSFPVEAIVTTTDCLLEINVVHCLLFVAQYRSRGVEMEEFQEEKAIAIEDHREWAGWIPDMIVIVGIGSS